MIKTSSMKKYIPNALTLLNLFCGSIAVIFAVNNNYVAAALFVFLGIFFDFFDGFAARKLNVQSALGVQLDSLADMVTSGLVPGIIMYKLIYLAVDDRKFCIIGDAGIHQIVGNNFWEEITGQMGVYFRENHFVDGSCFLAQIIPVAEIIIFVILKGVFEAHQG